ncbi:tetratricopeptide repeat protein 8 isoform X1 [Hydra vulgaris]|nr:tetratricopeptide repeat protein 8 [Hydra vulgaris]
MDPMYIAMSYFRRKRFDNCLEILSNILTKNPYDQAAWSLKTRVLTEQVYVDEVEVDEEGIAELLMDDTAIAQIARPGTSLKQTNNNNGGPSPAVRPTTQSGRPVSGFVRPGTQGGRPGTMEQAIKTPRTANTARPATTASGRFVRLGTASMLTQPDGPFINVSKINFAKYVERPNLAKELFEYIFMHENDARNALQLAALAIVATEYKDWWWKVQLAKCYYRLGLYRDAEKQLISSLRDEQIVDTYLYLCKVYVKLDQPLTGIEILVKGLEKFPQETTLLVGIARIYEGMNDVINSTKFYKDVLISDNTNVEAISCIATNYFYSDQPEIALKFFRRLLQMGVYNCEIFNNIGLCCFYAQQYDMALNCFERALALSSDDNMADVWYNISHIAIGIGDMRLAYQCLRLSLSVNSDHAEAFNNLGVLELRRNNSEEARSHFQSSISFGEHMYEPHYNLSFLSEQIGDTQTSFQALKRSLEIFPDHAEGKDLLKLLRKQLAAV